MLEYAVVEALPYNTKGRDGVTGTFHRHNSSGRMNKNEYLEYFHGVKVAGRPGQGLLYRNK
jgi:hypothetical protein